MAKEKGKPLTREDVLKLIEQNGGKADGLNLSERVFEEGIDLSDLDLHGIIFKDARFPTHFEGTQLVGAKFDGSNLNGADLRSINLQYAQFRMLNNQPAYLEAADLRGSLLLNTNFQGADLNGAKFGDVAEAERYPAAMLDNTDFRGTKLSRANFKGCYFYGTQLEGAFIRGADIFDAHLEETDWGSYIIGEENKKDFYSAVHYYRRLKTWYTNTGMNDIAAKFYYREKEAARKSLIFYYIHDEVGNKSLKLLPKNWRHRIALQLSYWVFGHGEGWKRLLFWVAGFILLFALIYFAFDETRQWQYFGDYIYFSTVSFTALGYGSWLHVTNNWIKGIGALESFIGVFSMALLLVTFVRKWTR